MLCTWQMAPPWLATDPCFVAVASLVTGQEQGPSPAAVVAIENVRATGHVAMCQHSPVAQTVGATLLQHGLTKWPSVMCHPIQSPARSLTVAG